jgi:hypothetical protein
VIEKIDLEPGNSTEVLNLDTDAIITNKKKVTVNLAATLALGKKENFIKYDVPGGNRKEVTLIIQSRNADFFMTITEQRSATGAWEESTLTLDAKNNNASAYVWNVKQGNHVVVSDKGKFTFKFKAEGFVPGDLPIMVVLEVKNESDQCNGTARYPIVDAIYRLKRNQPKFDNLFQP